MKVWIEEDEYWPYYFVDVNMIGEIEAEVDEETYQRWLDATVVWGEVQAEIKALYLKGFSNV